ncbi:hypothetical protein NL676_035154 [Syzygium grande]|nr:hypothetical protein NL676_035154 [Syzygium grande]
MEWLDKTGTASFGPCVGRRQSEIDLLRDYNVPLKVLPKGFLDRTAGIGKGIGWALWAGVLAHPAIGGFALHYKCKSTLKSIWSGVVPVL